MLKAYKYRIYPNNEQKIQIAKTFGCCRFVYNQTLAYRKEVYEKEKKSVSKTDCNNYCNRQLKKDVYKRQARDFLCFEAPLHRFRWISDNPVCPRFEVCLSCLLYTSRCV